MDLDNFIEDLSSSSPAPGGGAASAVFGVLGTALASMVCALTEGRNAYEQHEAFVIEQHKKIIEIQEKFKEAKNHDIEAFMQISSAYKMPKDTDDQKQARSNAIQEALIPATQTPLNIMKLAAECLDITNTLIDKTNKQTISDIGCAVLGLKAAIQGAYLNVKINLSSSKNPLLNFENESQKILERYIPLADSIYETVLKKL